MADPEFVDWCLSSGVQLNGIVAAYVEEGWRGIVATRGLAPDEVVLRVPERLLMTTRSARRDPQLAAALQRCGGGATDGGLTPFQLLAVHLLHEVSRGSSSAWHPYLRQLPRSCTSLPNFSQQQAEALQLPHGVEAAQAAAAKAREDWMAAEPVLQELGLPKRLTGLRAWLWAASTLASRTMYLPWCPAGALTPYGDLHNYQPPPPPFTPCLESPDAGAPTSGVDQPGAIGADGGGGGGGTGASGAQGVQVPGQSSKQGDPGSVEVATPELAELQLSGSTPPSDGRPAADAEGCSSIAGDGSWDEQGQAYCIFARRRYRAGEQVMLCYGRHTNLELLEHYGFVLDDNPHDAAPLDVDFLPLPPSARALPGPPPPAPAEAFLHPSGHPSWALLAWLRRCAATPAERRTLGHALAAGERISEEGDRQVLRWLSAACLAQLARLPTTLRDDMQALRALEGQESRKQGTEAGPQGQAAAAAEQAAAMAAAAELSDGLTCEGLALRWRVQQKRALANCVRLADRVLGPEAAAPAPRAAAAAAAATARGPAQRPPPRRPAA
ncbi:hypothetical protein HYH03_001056 [Edaphochlamys debaryana]|uniref:Rubisco LSMT substrate-binding domain-containing protein n=1 Tax=Edaphochlamys debaryana TaxID=47281 RepID=A0A836C6T5_9CHLO|nr:hypothetical protein HYH03_001056 [Edaphochlamys debaryana]|eukprot:KAG2501249.1 hypothetical protein HYH03_001056 [Edaphochlamys debaryana]